MHTTPSLGALALTAAAFAFVPALSQTAEAPKAPASAGLANDWLRAQASEFKSWDLGGQFRLRYEARENGGFVANRDFLQGTDNSNDYFLFRTKAHVGWAPESWISAYVEGRDSHDVSDQRAVTDTDTFDLHQAYLRLGDPKKFPVTLKIGRQEMLYGDERYIGNADWSNTGRAFDAAKLRFENDLLWVDAFASRVVIPRDEHFNIANDYDWFSGVYGSTRKLVPWQETELYFLARNVGASSPAAVATGVGGPGQRDIYTVGTRWKSLPGQLGEWDYVFEAAGQFGHLGAGAAQLDHEALALNGTGGYTFKDVFGAPRAAVGYDFGSGDSSAADGKNGTFEQLFGTNHKLYGIADLVGQRNMHIPRAGVSVKPIKDLTVSAEWLSFFLVDTGDLFFPESGAGRAGAGTGYGRNGQFDSYVGQEIDLNAVWRFASWGQLQGGYAHFFTGDYIRQSAANGGRSAEDADWGYLQFVLSF